MSQGRIPSIAVSTDREDSKSDRFANAKMRLVSSSTSGSKAKSEAKPQRKPKAPPKGKAPAQFYNTDMCPIRNGLDGVMGKWPLLLLTHLSFGSHRFTELSGAVPDISQRMLTKTLRRLEADGIVLRTEYKTMPPHVDYSLTELGQSLIPLIEPFLHWGLRNRSAIEAVRKASDKT